METTTIPFALQGVQPAEDELSDKQARILDFIQVFHAQNDRPPTNREIGHGVGIRSTSHVNYHLRILEEKGYIERIRNTSRGLRLKTSARHLENEVVSVPVWGRIAAGEPIEARRSSGESIVVSTEFAPPDSEAFALQVQGTSMIDALIADGDWIIVRPQEHAENGDLVVATLTSERGDEREATLKRFYREGTRIRLQPANSTMQPIYVEPERLLIQGKVMAVLRKL
ncbi:MAG TPA: transcriptional repressor LexA [Chloroflexota bacterium]|nr:transcriptional repressor LexA [Chloroflexota bacterium]